MTALAQSAPAVTFEGPQPRLSASLHLEFAVDAHSGQTILRRNQTEPPLRVVREFALADGSALAHLHNVSGGLLGGDQLSLSVDVGPGASAQLTTTGATRIYRPRPLSAPTCQINRVRVAENALLEYVPDPIIPFAGSRFAQTTSIELAPGAGLFWWEILAPGREARGEAFEYESIEMKSDVTAERLIAAEQIRLAPRDRSLSSIARLGRYPYWGSFYICRAGTEPGVWLRAEQHLREVASELSSTGPVFWGISTLVAHGLAIRCVAGRGRDVVGGMHALWGAAKRFIFNRDAIPPRKVH
ncbi:MAG TPA: urease accessory protein UreD [Candidatus Limnocylindrales bacterium]|nr:urease accessory protein UreD [Candidatus Limnocylindrales bacterium]